MFCRSRSISVIFIAGISLVLAVRASPQTQTTGRITGTVKDAQGAVIVGAELSVENAATGDRHSAVTDSSGTYSILQLPPAIYLVNIRARGFSPAVFHDVAVGLAETSTINASLTVAQRPRGRHELHAERSKHAQRRSALHRLARYGRKCHTCFPSRCHRKSD